MAKREFISREEALSHPFANGKYDHKNADINFILGHESYKEWLETFPAFNEQDIVKPVLDKIRAEIIEMRSRQNVGVLECLDIIDKYRTESEVDNRNDDN